MSGKYAGYMINGTLELLKDSQIKLARMNVMATKTGG